MKVGNLLFICILAGVVASGCNETVVEEANAAAESATDCTACHQGKRSFSGRDVDALAEAIRSIRDGKVRHPPLGLSDETDAAIDALAERLAGN